MTSYKKTMRQALEEMYPIVEGVELDEAKYELYHKDFSSAMQHAYHVAKKHHGITIDPKEIDDKVATGPSKPSEGKTNKYRLKGDKGAVQIQVYNKGGSKPFELNMYKEQVELDESKYTGKLMKNKSIVDYVKKQQEKNRKKVAKFGNKKVGSFGNEPRFDSGYNWLDMASDEVKLSSMSLDKRKAFDAEAEYEAIARKLGIDKFEPKLEEVDLDEGKMAQMHQMMKDKKSAAQIAKEMGLDVKTVKALMDGYNKMVPESFEIGTEKYLKHTVNTTPGQKEWTETVTKKAASMRETLAKMWGVDEGKNVFEKDSKKDLTSEVKGGTTMTGKKVADIDTKPTIKEKKK
jgi:hypothetical protein